MALNIFSREAAPVSSRNISAEGRFVPAPTVEQPRDPLAAQLKSCRFGKLVRERAENADHPNAKKIYDQAVNAIDEQFALVPEGFVSISGSIFDQPGGPEFDIDTEPYLLARFATTNAEFQFFVDAGGYEDLQLWPEELWPHVIDFKDQTGYPGPRYWREGRHHQKLAAHPVVGVSFYEAQAYAAWAGYRLPTEAEWQMAATWRLRSSAHVHRSYPWGDALDLESCNIWASGHSGTLPVNACPGGAAPNGVQQLIGNVWEWTSDDFEALDREGRIVIGDTVLKVIRGGAFDTYFPWQAVSTFRSGVNGVMRSNNMGFRCALDLSAV